MSSVQVRIPAHAWAELRRVFSSSVVGREPMAFGLVSSAVTARERLVLVREIVVPPDDAFMSSDGHGARWKGAYTIELLNRALSEGRGLIIFHSHGEVPAVRLSADDRQSAAVLLPKFQQIAPDRPHGSIVFGDRCAAGLLIMPGEREMTDAFSVRCFSRTMVTVPEEGTPDELLLLRRQPLAANPAVTRCLARARVAVVGLSGGGSQVVPQLAALGVGTIVGIDPQRIDASNAFATSRIGWLDVLLRRWKTRVARDRAWWVDRRTRFLGVRARVPDQEALDAVKAADVVVGCVNNMHARADLMELCWRYCIPYIDIGLRVSVTSPWASSDPAPISGVFGNAFVAIPGGACMWCTEFLTRAKLDAETGGMGRSYLRDGGGEKDAWVLSFNGLLASQAVSEVLQLLVGYAPSERDRTYRRFDGFAATMTECIVKRSSRCETCGHVLAAGDPVWA